MLLLRALAGRLRPEAADGQALGQAPEEGAPNRARVCDACDLEGLSAVCRPSA